MLWESEGRRSQISVNDGVRANAIARVGYQRTWSNSPLFQYRLSHKELGKKYRLSPYVLSKVEHLVRESLRLELVLVSINCRGFTRFSMLMILESEPCIFL